MENKTNKENLPSCCQPQKKGKEISKGIMFGLVPHIGCIAFIIFTLLGITAAAAIFKPLLAKAYFFYIMIGISLLFTSISAFFYLRRFGGVSQIKHHKKYLSILYGSAIGISALLYLVIFPLVVGVAASTGIATGPETITIQVQIPCSGHAPLITSELKTSGVDTIQYIPSNKFKLTYSPDKITQQQIVNLDIFKEYPAKIV